MKHTTHPLLLSAFLLMLFVIGLASLGLTTASAQDTNPNVKLPETDDGLPGA